MCHIILFFTMLIPTFYSSTEPTLISREEIQIVRTDDEKNNTQESPWVEYTFIQNTNIENNQSNQVSSPVIKEDKPTQTVTESDSFFSQFSYRYILGPLGVGALGCLGYALYYAKTKFNLYSLSKACVEHALWSMWKHKNASSLESEQLDTDLLMDILSTYKTDRYTVAISHFLQDVELEIDLLQQYVREAESTQSGSLKFAFDDLTHEILEAKTRILTLSDLRKLVLGWLQQKGDL